MDEHSLLPGLNERLSLVIPAYNEEAGIRQAILEADQALTELVCDYEILVVDDGSNDGTAEAIQEAMRDRPRVRLLRHADNRGYSAALRTGFEAAQFDRIAFTDADCQFYLSDLASLIPLSDRYPLVVGFRIDRQDPWRRRFMSWGYNTLARAFLNTGVRDCDCALKVFRKEALTTLLPETPGFFVNTEILSRARQYGYRIAEVGVRHRPRLHGESKVSLSHIPRVLSTFFPFWWSQILFPTPSTDSVGGQGGRQRIEHAPAGVKPTARLAAVGSLVARHGELLGLSVLILLAAMLFFSRLGCPLQEPQEPRYAEIPRQMLAQGRWITPVLHGEPYYQKPPLLYWSVMGSYLLWGVHDWAARLASCGACFLTVLVTYFWGCRTAGVRAGFAGAMILCLSGRFVYLGRLLTMDGLLCLWVVTALAAAHLAIQGSRLNWRWWMVSAIACGLGLLTKGPVALVLVGVPVLVGNILDPRLSRLSWRGWLIYLLAAISLAGPWYAAATVADEHFALDFFWLHNIQRFWTPFDHEEPIWFYLPGLLLGMLPWTLLLPGFLKFLKKHSRRTAAYRPPALGFYLLAFGWCFLFFSLAGCKRATYILPAMPALALGLGCYLNALLPRHLEAAMGSVWAWRASLLAYRATLAMLAASAVLCLAAISLELLKPMNGVCLAGAAGIGFALVYRPGQSRRPVVSWLLCTGTTFVLLFVAVQQVLPSYARRFSLRGQVRPLAQAEDSRLSVVCYPRRWDSISFYLGRQDVRVYTAQDRLELIQTLQKHPQTLVFVKAVFANEFLNALPSDLEFVPRGRQGHLLVGCIRPRHPVDDGMYAKR